MKIERSHQTNEAPLIQDILPVRISADQSTRDMLVTSNSKKGATVGACLKGLWKIFTNFIQEILSIFAIEPSKLDIIEEMLYDSEVQAKEFVKHFQDNLNACVQAAFYDPIKVRDLIEDNRSKYKEFCRDLGKQMRKTTDLEGKLTDQKAAVTKALGLMWEDISRDSLKANNTAEIIKHNIPTFGRIVISFCNEMKNILESSRVCEENLKPQLQALKNLVSDLIPRIGLEMTKQQGAFTKFVTDLFNLKDFKADTIIACLQKNTIINGLMKKQDFEDIKLCFGQNNQILDKLADKDFASKFGLSKIGYINYTMVFLQSITAEQFEALIPALIGKDLNADLRRGVVELFRQIKNTEEPITEERLGKALECLDLLFTNFENYKTIDARDAR